MAITEVIFRPKFTPMNGGYLLETPNPWLLGPPGRYMVTEEQKASVTTSTAPKRPILGYALLVAGLLAISSGMFSLWSFAFAHDRPAHPDFVGLDTALLLAIYGGAVLLVRRQLRRIEAVVGAAVPMQAQSTQFDWALAIGNAMPKWALQFSLVVWTLTTLVRIVALAFPAASPFLGGRGSYTAVLTSLVFTAASLCLLRMRAARQAP